MPRRGPAGARPGSIRKFAALYSDLFDAGYCHTVETWADGKLVGGLYGVALNGAFFGESMFSTARDASKVALVYLCARLIRGGFSLLDTQFVTEHLRQFGTVEIDRANSIPCWRRRWRTRPISCALPKNAHARATSSTSSNGCRVR